MPAFQNSVLCLCHLLRKDVCVCVCVCVCVSLVLQLKPHLGGAPCATHFDKLPVADLHVFEFIRICCVDLSQPRASFRIEPPNCL